MRTSDMVKSKFFGGRDVQGQPPIFLKIATVTEELFTRGGTPEVQYFLWFTNHLKGLKLNKTRIKVLEAAYGPDSDLWVGKRVKLTFDPGVKFGNVTMGSIVVEVPPGTVFTGTPGGNAGWGEAPRLAGPPGAPPPPVWNAATRTWDVQGPVASNPAQPPPPVWNAATGVWDVVNPATGEMAPPAKAANPQDATWGGAPTLSQRIAWPPADGWGEVSSGAAADFNDDIPF